MHLHTVCFSRTTYITHFNTYRGGGVGLEGFWGGCGGSGCEETIVAVVWERTVGGMPCPPLAVLCAGRNGVGLFSIGGQTHG